MGTVALFNSNQRGDREGGNNLPLEVILKECANEGAYVIGLLACDRANLPKPEEEERYRGGTE